MVGRPGFPLYSVSFSPDGQSVISGSNDGTVRLWSVLTRQQVAVMSEDENPMLSVAFAHHHSWIVSGDTGGSVRFWDSVAHQPIGVPPPGDHNWVSTVAFNANDTRVLSGRWDENLQLQPPPNRCYRSVVRQTRRQHEPRAMAGVGVAVDPIGQDVPEFTRAVRQLNRPAVRSTILR